MIIAFAFAVEPATNFSGYWTNEAHSVVVLLAPCGAVEFCGTVESASEKAQADARRGGTANLIGTELLHGLEQVGVSRWRGTLFVPDLHKRSKAEIVQLDPDRLRIRGCAVGRMLCKTQIWVRTDAP